MQVTIIGAGNMGRGIAHTLARGGTAVTLIDRDPADASALATEVRSTHPAAKVDVAPLDGALGGEVVVLAVYHADAQELATRMREQLAGKIVIDISNPVNGSYDGLVTAPGTSAAEELARLLPESRIVKAFNTTFAGTLVDGHVAGQPLDVFVASDDEEAKRIVIGLVDAGGLRGIDVGGLERARSLEGLGLLGITLQFTQGTNFQSAWRFVS